MLVHIHEAYFEVFEKKKMNEILKPDFPIILAGLHVK